MVPTKLQSHIFINSYSEHVPLGKYVNTFILSVKINIMVT
jgi:hypothetical protein